MNANLYRKTMMTTVTVLGLGAMGSRIALNLIESNYQVNVWNRNADRCLNLVARGARQFENPKEAVADADFIIAMLSDDNASRDVWLTQDTGALFGLKQSAIAIECSTLSLSWTLALAKQFKDKNQEFIDAPVVGSRPQAENAQLIHLAGGEPETIDRVRELLSVNSSVIHHTGQVGNGMILKLAINGLFGMQVSALSEMLGMLKTLGIANESAVAIVNELPTTSPALKAIGLAIVSGKFDPLFPIALIEKDFSYLELLADAKDSAIPLANTTRATYKKAMALGYAEKNISAVSQLYS